MQLALLSWELRSWEHSINAPPRGSVFSSVQFREWGRQVARRTGFPRDRRRAACRSEAAQLSARIVAQMSRSRQPPAGRRAGGLLGAPSEATTCTPPWGGRVLWRARRLCDLIYRLCDGTIREKRRRTRREDKEKAEQEKTEEEERQEKKKNKNKNKKRRRKEAPLVVVSKTLEAHCEESACAKASGEDDTLLKARSPAAAASRSVTRTRFPLVCVCVRTEGVCGCREAASLMLKADRESNANTKAFIWWQTDDVDFASVKIMQRWLEEEASAGASSGGSLESNRSAESSETKWWGTSGTCASCAECQRRRWQRRRGVRTAERWEGVGGSGESRAQLLTLCGLSFTRSAQCTVQSRSVFGGGG